MRRPPTATLFVTVLLYLASMAMGIVVVEPSASTVWGTSGTNTIVWSLTPATVPAPTSQYFQIFIINGTPLYTPSLNVSIAQYVDALAATSIGFQLADQLLPGDGYRLLFTSPQDGSVVYCTSDIFTLASGAGLTGVASSATSTGGSAAASGSASTTAKTSATSTAAYHAATAPGGPAEQGFSLGFSGAGAGKGGMGKAVISVVGAALVMALLF